MLGGLCRVLVGMDYVLVVVLLERYFVVVGSGRV